MYQVKKLCDRALWLRRGRTAALGSADEVIDAYLEYTRARDAEQAVSPAAAGRDPALLRLVDVVIEGGEGGDPPTWRSGAPFTARVVLERSRDAGIEPGVGIAFVRNDGLVCYCVSTEMDGVAMHARADGRFEAALHVPSLPLLGGGYYLNVATTDNRSALIVYDVRERCCPFRVRNPSDEYGVVRMDHQWLGPRSGSGCD